MEEDINGSPHGSVGEQDTESNMGEGGNLTESLKDDQLSESTYNPTG